MLDQWTSWLELFGLIVLCVSYCLFCFLLCRNLALTWCRCDLNRALSLWEKVSSAGQAGQRGDISCPRVLLSLRGTQSSVCGPVVGCLCASCQKLRRPRFTLHRLGHKYDKYDFVNASYLHSFQFGGSSTNSILLQVQFFKSH